MASVPPLTPPLSVARVPGEDDGEHGIGHPVSELLAADIDPPAWLVPNYIAEQSINILGGPPNSGKTLLAFDWCAKAVANGKRVFIAENEGGAHSLQKRLRRSCSAAGVTVLPTHFRYERNMRLVLSNFAEVKAFAKRLLLYDLILLDSLGSLWPGLNENDPEHMSVVAEALKVLCENSGAAILGNHHTTKAAWKPGERPSLGDLRGHGAMAGRIDGAFICRPLERAAGVVRFELHTVKQRDEEWHPPQAVEVQMTGDAASVSMDPLQSKAKEVQVRTQDIERVVWLAAPQDETQATSANVLCTRVRKSKPDVLAAVRNLYERGALNQTPIGRYYRAKGSHLNDPGGNHQTGSGWRRPFNPGEDNS